MTGTDTTRTRPAPAPLSLQLTEADEGRRRGLRRMRAVALSLLVLAAVVYAITYGDDGWRGYVNAAAEAGMVGAIADWFAVTALFRHPLGLPIPHTAIIPRRKETLGESLQEFVAENFLREEVVRERIESAHVSRRVGQWLLDDDHAAKVVTEAARIASDALSYVKEPDVAAIIEHAVFPRLSEEPLSPAVGQLLSQVLADRAHDGLVDLMLDELGDWLGRHEREVTAIIEERAPDWTPEWLDKRVSKWLHKQVVRWIDEIGAQPHHAARQALDRWLADLADDLQHDADTMQRFEALKARILTQPRVLDTSIRLWDALRRALIGALGDEDGLLRTRMLEEVETGARRLIEDQALADRLDDRLADIASYAVATYGSEVATIISATVNRWDGKETAERIELHVGKDLQFIRINGTVVGGLAGLTIHTISHLL